jgi:hypothetical protein
MVQIILLVFFFAFLAVAIFHFVKDFKKNKKWHYWLVPLLITLISFAYHDPCKGMFCFFSGRGFPLGYYSDTNSFGIWILAIDFIFWAFFYIIIWIIIWFFKIIIKKINK